MKKEIVCKKHGYKITLFQKKDFKDAPEKHCLACRGMATPVEYSVHLPWMHAHYYLDRFGERHDL